MTEFESARSAAVRAVRTATQTAAQLASRAAVLDAAARTFPAEARAAVRVDGPSYQTQYWGDLEFEFGRHVPVATAVAWMPPAPAQLELVASGDFCRPKFVFRPRGATGYRPVAPLALDGEEVHWWTRFGDHHAYVVAQGGHLAPANLVQVAATDPRRLVLPSGDDDPELAYDLALFADGLDLTWAVTTSATPSPLVVENFLYRISTQAADVAAACGWKVENGGDPKLLLAAARRAVLSQAGIAGP
jgi:hypothetical protein